MEKEKEVEERHILYTSMYSWSLGKLEPNMT